jgi:hypothetical protein
MGFISIQTSILAILTGLTTVDSNKIFAAGTAKTTGYPYITLECLGESEEDKDELNKYQVFKWRIRCYANMDNTGAGPVWAETTILTVLDEIKDKFNKAYTLSATVDNMEWETINTGYTPFEAGEARVLDMVLKVYKLKDVVS